MTRPAFFTFGSTRINEVEPGTIIRDRATGQGLVVGEASFLFCNDQFYLTPTQYAQVIDAIERQNDRHTNTITLSPRYDMAPCPTQPEVEERDAKGRPLRPAVARNAERISSPRGTRNRNGTRPVSGRGKWLFGDK